MASETAIASGILAVIGGMFVGLIIWYIFQLIAGWKMMVKMGEPGWKSLIPFYGTYVIYEHTWNGMMYGITLVLQVALYALQELGSDSSGLLTIVTTAISLAVIVLQIFACNKLSKSFGHGVGYTIGLWLLRPIFYLILGFGSSEYIGNTTEGSNY